MSCDIKVSRTLNNNCSQVDINSKRLGARHYRVPNENIDTFRKDYEKFNKSASKIATLTFIPLALGGALIGCGIGNLCKAGLVMKTIISTVGAMAGTYCANIIGANMITDRENKVLNKNQAEPMYFKNSIDDII